ncbi:MAG: GlsB/YeaQ/YmgE family stress response membrane protein [Acidobacteriaceae bacterium]|nr:GlsB/YeaQ/YmgE family stress response membrane protein [Acidobacteriaceae bacterium]
MKGHGYGVLPDIVVGIVGSLVGGIVMRMCGFADDEGLLYTVFAAFLGSIILTWRIRRTAGNQSSRF